ncbi:MAG TPA: SDR family oxidoreductase [Gemmataceae bacterium]|jgi:NAD(P)-dependent dehydrogenase (short-subunit alcohol dehydrogenase family)|nr:SDR family oxidoreductase [Gemmataceae bacterium]
MAARLTGKRCLIIGGTSGIGLAAAHLFLAEGAKLVVVGRDPPEAEQVRGVLVKEGPAHVVAAEVTKTDAVVRVMSAVVSQMGGLDSLFHVAGGSGRQAGDGALHECTDDGWTTTLDLNLRSVFLTNRAVVRQFLSQRAGGAIVNTSSVLAFSPSPRHFDTCAYTAAKGGIVSLSRQAAARYAADRIRVNVLAPGLTNTPMAARAVKDPAVAAYIKSKQPVVAGPISPQACAEAAVFLCSDAARSITGAVLTVDGGWCVSEGQHGGSDPSDE